MIEQSTQSNGTTRSSSVSPGFTLIEVLVALVVLVMVFGAVVIVTTASDRMARAQSHVSEMQQSLRIAQHDLVRTVRMAGRGGMPRGDLPTGLAVAVRNNVPASGDEHHIAIGDTGSPEVLAGTDVLTVRGVLSSPLYQAGTDADTFELDSEDRPTRGTIRLRSPCPTTGVPQDLRHLATAIRRGLPDALIMVSPLADEIYAVVELDGAGSTINATGIEGDATDLTLAFRIVGGTHTESYSALSPGGGFPASLRAAAFVGLLEEQRFYVKEERSIPGDSGSRLTPRLARARMYPGTQMPYAGSPFLLGSDISDGVIDLQVALGIDVDGDNEVLENEVAPGSDEWLFNDVADDPLDAAWNSGAKSPTLFWVRIQTLARTHRPEPRHLSPAIDSLGDRRYDETDPPGDEAEASARQFRRRRLETLVDLRNL